MRQLRVHVCLVTVVVPIYGRLAKHVSCVMCHVSFITEGDCF